MIYFSDVVFFLIIRQPPRSPHADTLFPYATLFRSEHPLADAIVAEARRRNFESDRVEYFDSVTGMGVRGSVAGHELALGNTALMDDLGADRKSTRLNSSH